jgi:hypothetical protein
MSDEVELLDRALRDLASPRLSPNFAARVLATAKAHLEPAAAEGPSRLRLLVAQALVPGLLATAAVDHVVETVGAIDAVYGKAVRGQVPAGSSDNESP